MQKMQKVGMESVHVCLISPPTLLPLPWRTYHNTISVSDINALSSLLSFPPCYRYDWIAKQQMENTFSWT
jgi:hypothetical protein